MSPIGGCNNAAGFGASAARHQADAHLSFISQGPGSRMNIRKSFSRPFRKLAWALAALASPAVAAPVANDLDPPLWVVKDADTTIYLFGTVHALDGKQQWFNDEIKQAFDASQELVVEVITPDKPEEVLPYLQKYALDTSGRTLTSKLSPTYQAKLAAVLKGHGKPANFLDHYKPMFASISLLFMDLNKGGIDGKVGVEAILRDAARTQGKPVDAVETMDKQMSFFAALDDAKQVRMLEEYLDQSGQKTVEGVGILTAAWGRADIKSIDSESRKMDVQDPEFYQLMYTSRNRNWAAWIDQRLDRPGTVFMAVGAAHLVGRDSVQNFLKKRGIRTARIKHVERVH
jgi:uncharacterized protein YbaP (TraB family)